MCSCVQQLPWCQLFMTHSAAMNMSEVNAVCWVLKLISFSTSSVLNSGQGDPVFRKESWNLLQQSSSDQKSMRPGFPVNRAFITTCWCLSSSLPSSLSLQGFFFHLICNEYSGGEVFPRSCLLTSVFLKCLSRSSESGTRETAVLPPLILSLRVCLCIRISDTKIFVFHHWILFLKICYLF